MSDTLDLTGICDDNREILRTIAARFRRLDERLSKARRQPPVVPKARRREPVVVDVVAQPRPDFGAFGKWCGQCARRVSESESRKCVSSFCKARP